MALYLLLLKSLASSLSPAPLSSAMSSSCVLPSPVNSSLKLSPCSRPLLHSLPLHSTCTSQSTQLTCKQEMVKSAIFRGKSPLQDSAEAQTVGLSSGRGSIMSKEHLPVSQQTWVLVPTPSCTSF